MKMSQAVLPVVSLLAAVSATAMFSVAAPSARAADEKKGSEEAAEETSTIALAGHTFSYGEPWAEKQVSSPMRAAELSYDHEDGELADLDLVFYHFPNQGGGTRANLDRWIGQFAGTPEVEEEELEFDGTKVVMLVATGTYNESSGGPFSGNSTPRENYTMLAAVVETKSGPVFLKLYGPKDSVAAMRADFKKLLTSPFEE